MEPPPPNQAHAHTRMHQQVVYETACVLAESATLVEAAPRMLQAICGALGWDYGGFWTVDRTAAQLRWAATWHASSLPLVPRSVKGALDEAFNREALRGE